MAASVAKDPTVVPLRAVRTVPLPDEITSSWVVRTAHAFGLSGYDLGKSLRGTNLFWLKDVDNHPDDPTLQEIGAKVGVSPQKIRATSLAALAGVLHETAGRRKMWVLNRGEWERSVSFGLQFCSQCLAEDELPYYRRWWRLSLAVSCPRHGEFLSDRCPSCAAPVRLQRIEPVAAKEPSSSNIARCHRCAFDFRKALPPTEDRFNPTKLHAYQRFYWNALRRGHLTLPGFGPIAYSFLYFYTLWHLTNKIYRVKSDHAQRLREAVREELGLPELELQTKANEFEALCNSDRRILLWMAGWLVDDWPGRFVRLCREAGLTSSTFDKIKIENPYWFAKTLREDLAVDYSQRRQLDPKKKSEWQRAKRFQKRGSPRYRAFLPRMRFVREHPELWSDSFQLGVALANAGLYGSRRYTKKVHTQRGRIFSQLALTTTDDYDAWAILSAKPKKPPSDTKSPVAL